MGLNFNSKESFSKVDSVKKSPLYLSFFLSILFSKIYPTYSFQKKEEKLGGLTKITLVKNDQKINNRCNIHMLHGEFNIPGGRSFEADFDFLKPQKFKDKTWICTSLPAYKYKDFETRLGEFKLNIICWNTITPDAKIYTIVDISKNGLGTESSFLLTKQKYLSVSILCDPKNPK